MKKLTLILVAFIANAQSKKECQELVKAEKYVADNIKMHTATWDKIFNQRDINQVNSTNFSSDVVLLGQTEKVRAQGIEILKAHIPQQLSQ